MTTGSSTTVVQGWGIYLPLSEIGATLTRCLVHWASSHSQRGSLTPGKSWFFLFPFWSVNFQHPPDITNVCLTGFITILVCRKRSDWDESWELRKVGFSQSFHTYVSMYVCQLWGKKAEAKQTYQLYPGHLFFSKETEEVSLMGLEPTPLTL